jgi:hypothetical protein
MNPFTLTTHATGTVTMARVLAYAVVALGSAILLYYLYAYVDGILADTDPRSWLFVGVGIGAGVVYGVSGAVHALTSIGWLGPFVEGATLFFILFVALGIREMYFMSYADGDTSKALPDWVDFVVIGGFVASWWAGFLIAHRLSRLVVVVGWIGAALWALYYSVLAVRKHEGTSIAALVRTLLPAVVAVTVVVFADIAGSYAGAPAAVDAVWLVGTVLVGSFLFTTAIAIRQQGGEVERMYDWTTWRGQTLEERPDGSGSGRPSGGRVDD